MTRFGTLFSIGLLLAAQASGQGVQQWIAIYGPTNDYHEPMAIAADALGNIVVTGIARNPTNFDIATIKYAAATGTALWTNRYNGPAGGNDYAADVIVDYGTNVIITGFSYNGTNNDFYTAKYAGATGALLWEQRYNGPANGSDQASALACDRSNNVFVTGFSYNGTNYDCATVKYAANTGAGLWTNRYNSPANGNDGAVAIAVDTLGNAAITGYSSNGTNNDIYTARLAATTGQPIWQTRYNCPTNNIDLPGAVAVDAADNVIVTGTSHNGKNLDIYTAKSAAATGTVLWERRYNGTGNGDDVGKAIAVDPSSNVVVAGYARATNTDCYIAKYNGTTGTNLWEVIRSVSTNGQDLVVATGTDSTGHVFVTGYTRNAANTDNDLSTAKFNAATGALLWGQAYTLNTNTYEETFTSKSLVVTPDGGCAVTGRGSTNTWSYITIKYGQ